METLSQALASLDLSEKQIAVYTVLLEVGRGSAQRIAKLAGIKRTTTYTILNELDELGLVSSIPDSAQTFYRPLSPELLLQNKSRKLQNAAKVIPEIEAVLKKEGVEEKPRVLYFKGVEGIKNLTKYRQEELANKTLTVFGATTNRETLDMFGDFFHQSSRDLMEMNTLERSITTDAPEVAEYNEMYNSSTTPLVEKKVLPAEIYNPETSFESSDKWLKIYDFTNLQGLIIESERAARAMKQIFELAWMGAKTSVLGLGTGESVTYSFTSLSSLDAYWKDTTEILHHRFKGHPVFFYEPHEMWIYLTGRAESQKQYLKSFDGENRTAFLTIGANTRLDELYKMNFSTKHLQVSTLPEGLFPISETIAVIGNFVVTSQIEESLAKGINEIYKTCSDESDAKMRLKELTKHFAKIKLKLENNPDKAAEIRKKLAENFDISQESIRKYNLF